MPIRVLLYEEVPGLRNLVKRVRAYAPLNAVLTRSARFIVRRGGVRRDWFVQHLPRSGSVSEDLPNGRSLRLWSHGDDWISTQVFWLGWHGYEPEMSARFFAIAQHARLTIDVGAYIGFYSLLAAHANPQGRVLALEPHPAIYERLQRNVLLNGLSNVTSVRMAAGAVAGRADFFHVPEGIPSSSSLSREFMTSGETPVVATAVDVARIDDLLTAHGMTTVDLVKIDTETTEPDVLEGMLATLQRDHPHIFCEVLYGKGTESRLESLLGPLGYRYYRLLPEGLRLGRSISEMQTPAGSHNYFFTTLPDEHVRGLLGQ